MGRPISLSPTPRELDVLRCMSHGMTRCMAADTLGISVETVKTHLEVGRLRLGAKTTAQAVATAIRRGMI